MKKVYLIRHGESDANVSNTWQGSKGGLTDKGRAQAQALGERLAGANFGALVSSPYERAAQTARILADAMGCETLEYSDLFVERRKPSIQIGMGRKSPESNVIEDAVLAHFGQDWHHSDEENYHDLVARGQAALEWLVAHPADELAVVTHGYFKRALVAVALAGDNITPGLCQHFLSSLRTTNTGISTLLYDEKRPDRPWWLWTWNDHSHVR